MKSVVKFMSDRIIVMNRGKVEGIERNGDRQNPDKQLSKSSNEILIGADHVISH
ncbi:hypothetical protein PJF56_12545 [Roseofilum sp. BLCC_M91]|uniref:Uncharacterized protein n=2 Tax=Roseofilum TaxID=1233426 RepID=A0ABT7B334_9CYAN|nr:MULTISPECIES: hypothetical protein [Roseofilum]MDJ1173560.1 hypothetical protein [Roseofilum capinflatum BLCC-M114]MDJ1179693.1 hypothetical protein [Roseofilum halophilum BLCC-M91]